MFVDIKKKKWNFRLYNTYRFLDLFLMIHTKIQNIEFYNEKKKDINRTFLKQ